LICHTYLSDDGVNVAARLEGVAEPGGVCLSEDAWRQVRDKLNEAFVDLGEKALKNIARPMRVYALNPGSAGTAHAPSVAALEKREPPRLWIVVLPFANIGGDPEQEHFVDGVTESLTTDLSRIRGAVVIARNTAFTFEGKPLDVKTIGRERWRWIEIWPTRMPASDLARFSSVAPKKPRLISSRPCALVRATRGPTPG
jgi:hypothetical protein